jgi:hypothetical protein
MNIRRRHCTLLLAVALLGCSAASTGFARGALDQSERIFDVRSWKMTFRYHMDVAYENDFGQGIGGAHESKVEAEGTVLFTRGYGRGFYRGEGQVDFSLAYSTLSKWGKYRVLDTEQAEGGARILPIPELNRLRFDPNTHSYSFELYPGEEIGGEGGDFGVPSRAFRVDNVTETVLREFREEGTPVPFASMLRAMAPPQRTWDEFVSNFTVAAREIPLPFFGLRLQGSYTDHEGGVVTWILEPADGTRDPIDSDSAVEIDGFENSEAWVHYHPPSAHEREELQSVWVPIIEGSKAEQMRTAALAGTQPFELFMVSSTQPGPPTGCGDWLKPFPADMGADQSGEAPPDYRAIEIEPDEKDPGMGPGSNVALALIQLLYGPVPADEPGVRNVAAENGLLLADLAQVGSRVRIVIGGQLLSEDACDSARVTAQLRHTALQFPGISTVDVEFLDRGMRQ